MRWIAVGEYKGFTVQISKDSMQFLLNGSLCFTASVNNKSVGYLDGHTVGGQDTVEVTQ